jgi:AmmeMemoRadiSam system protein B
MFYPAERDTLRTEVHSYIETGLPHALPHPPKALIAPHAGYIYSGPIAGSAYATLADSRRIITRVVLAGPSHRVGFRGLALSTANLFRTPLGDIPVDNKAQKTIEHLPGVLYLDRAHRDEHGLEVHLPFLQESLANFTIIPIVVGDAGESEMAAVLNALWGGDETLIVISSDLSHYLTYDEAVRLDRMTSDAILRFAPEDISSHQACGRIAIQGLLIAAGFHHLNAHLLDLRNSGDTAGDRSRVVGYGAYAFTN